MRTHALNPNPNPNPDPNRNPNPSPNPNPNPNQDEAAMVAALRAAAAAAGVEFVAFDGGVVPLETARALFARAVAVVGLHGGQAWPSMPLPSASLWPLARASSHAHSP